MDLQPINYLSQVGDPFEQAVQGFKLGAGIADVQQKQAVIQQAQEQAQLAAQEQSRFFSNPKPTMRDALQFASTLPKDRADAMRPYIENFSKEQQQNGLKQYGQILSALQANPETGINLLRDAAIASANSGDKQEEALFSRIADAAEKPELGGVPAAFKSLVTLTAQLPGAKDMFETIDKAASTARSEAQAPFNLQEAENKAIESGVTAEFARPMAVAKLKQTRAEALSPSVRETIDYQNLTPEQKGTFQSLQVLKKPPAAVTNVNVNNKLNDTTSQELGKLVPDLYNQANAAATQLSDIPRYRKALAEAVTGPLAEQRLTTLKVANALGFSGEKAINSSRELIQGLSEMALNSRSALAGQGAITDNEQKVLAKARSGDINFTKGELDVVFDVAERAAKAQRKKSESLLKTASGVSPSANMFLQNLTPLPQDSTLATSQSVTVNGKTYSKPTGFTDEKWAQYKSAMGVK